MSYTATGEYKKSGVFTPGWGKCLKVQIYWVRILCLSERITKLKILLGTGVVFGELIINKAYPLQNKKKKKSSHAFC